jgi:hypothetical protein
MSRVLGSLFTWDAGMRHRAVDRGKRPLNGLDPCECTEVRAVTEQLGAGPLWPDCAELVPPDRDDQSKRKSMPEHCQVERRIRAGLSEAACLSGSHAAPNSTPGRPRPGVTPSRFGPDYRIDQGFFAHFSLPFRQSWKKNACRSASVAMTEESHDAVL